MVYTVIPYSVHLCAGLENNNVANTEDIHRDRNIDRIKELAQCMRRCYWGD